MRHVRSGRGLLPLAAAVGLIAASAAGTQVAGTAAGQHRVSGFGAFTDASGGVEASADAFVDPDGGNPGGFLWFTRTWSDGVERRLSGDVAEGCVVIEGNVALVVARIPEEDEWAVPGLGTVQYAALVVEDAGGSGDRVAALGLTESTKAAACAAGPSHFDSAGRAPLDAGNFRVFVFVPSECDGPLSGTPQSGLTNVGFETGDFAGWRRGTVVDGIAITGPDGFNSPYEGDRMARLGNALGEEITNQPEGPNEICQDFVVTSEGERFVYSIFTYDYTGFDRFELRVSDPATGEVVAAHRQGAWGSGTELKTSGWKYVSLDLRGRLGQTLRLSISAGGTDDDALPFWGYVDSAESGPPQEVAPLGTATSATGSVMTDPQTGQVTIAMPSGDRSDVTVAAPVACPDGGAPTSVQLNLDGRLFPMVETPAGSGRYQTTIPAAEVESGTLTIEVVCGPTTFANTIGRIELYDPSGIVTDAVTGAPVVGAEVTLLKVPGWSPGTGGTDAGECQNDGPPWTQPAPTSLGVRVNPVLNEEIDPQVNPFVTNSIGYYGWDVATGCWYVEVAHPGYETLTSPVVGVPPPVDTLDLQLTPTGTTTGRTLTVMKAGAGLGTVTSSPPGIDCGASCSAELADGAEVTLTATAGAGSVFAGWSGACSGMGPCSVTMSQDRAVTATFDLAPRRLTVATAGAGAGTVTSAPGGIDCGATCAADYPNGSLVTLTALPALGSVFAGWSGACSGTGACAVTLAADQSVTATFQPAASPPPPAGRCTVPALKGKTLGAARQALRRGKCSLGRVKHVFSARVKKGLVVSQSPPPRTKLAKAARVNVVVSKGKR